MLHDMFWKEGPAGDAPAQLLTKRYKPHQVLIIYYFHSENFIA
jgi:hypothetical protein